MAKLISSICVSLLLLLGCTFPAFADMEEADTLGEEQVKEKQELRDMQNELGDIKSTVNDAMGELNELGKKFAGQGGALKEFHLFARESNVETYAGSNTHCLTYNGKIPGPVITVVEGDLVKIVLHNQLKTPTSLTFHGLVTPHSVGGIARTGAGVVAPNQAFIYQFLARQSGTFWYHPQLIHPTQKQLGLYGAIIVEPKIKARPHDKDITLVFSQLRRSATPASATTGSGATRKVTAVRASAPKSVTPLPTAKPSEPSDDAQDHVKPGFTALAWTDGATPPADVETDYLINGKPAPNIPPIEVRKGDRVRLRLINAGQEVIPLNFTGHRMEVIAINGGDPLEPHVFRDSITLNPSDRIDVDFTATNPGVWSFASELAHQASHKGKFPGGMACVVRYSEMKARPTQ